MKSGFRWLTAISLLMLVFGGAAILYARNSDSGSVSGVVRDGEGKALPGASVTLTSRATADITHATSGPAGEYHFSGLSDGEYTVGAEMAAYAAATPRMVQISQDSNTATVDLVLIRSSSRQ